MSFRTDEQNITRFQAVPFGSLSLLGDIHEIPFRGLDDSYADRLDFERGAIEADYLFTYVPGHGAVAVLPGPEKRLLPALGGSGGRSVHRLHSQRGSRDLRHRLHRHCRGCPARRPPSR